MDWHLGKLQSTWKLDVLQQQLIVIFLAKAKAPSHRFVTACSCSFLRCKNPISVTSCLPRVLDLSLIFSPVALSQAVFRPLHCIHALTVNMSCLTLQHLLHVDLLVLTLPALNLLLLLLLLLLMTLPVLAPASAYVPRTSADPEHRVGTPEHYDRGYPFLSLAHTCHPVLSNCSLLFCL